MTHNSKTTQAYKMTLNKDYIALKKKQGFHKDFFNHSQEEEEVNNTKAECSLKPVTRKIQKGYKLKRGYVVIPNEQRLELIESVFTNGETVKFAAQRLRINYSSAKAICQIYKYEGRTERMDKRYQKDKEMGPKDSKQSPSCEDEKLDWEFSEETKHSDDQDQDYIESKNILTNRSQTHSPQELAESLLDKLAVDHFLPKEEELLPSLDLDQRQVKVENLTDNHYDDLATSNWNLFDKNVQRQPTYDYTRVMEMSAHFLSKPQVKICAEIVNQQTQAFPLSVKSPFFHSFPHDLNGVHAQISRVPIAMEPIHYVPTRNVNPLLISHPQLITNEHVYSQAAVAQKQLRLCQSLQQISMWEGHMMSDYLNLQAYHRRGIELQKRSYIECYKNWKHF